MPPNSNYLSTAYRAVYAALKADSLVSAYMAANPNGWYLYDVGDKHPMEITGSDCPAIICSPAVNRMTMTPATNVSFDAALPLDFDLRVKEEAVDEVMYFFAIVVRALWARYLADRYGTAVSVGLYKVNAGGVAVSDVYETDAQKSRLVRVAWKATFPWTLLLRHNLAVT